MDAPGIAMTGEQDHALRESLPRNILDSLLEGCQVIGFDWRYLYVNEAAARQGRRPKEELLGRTMMEAYPGIEDTPMFAVLRQCMEERRPNQIENEFTFPDGSKGWFELRLEPVPDGVFILSLEITEQKRAEEARRRLEAQYLQAQKMEAVGRLAGGVAHDFNNLLSVILTYAGFLLDEVREGDPLRADILEIQRAGEQAASLTRQLLTFSRKQVLQPEVMDLNTVVSGMEEMLRRLIGEDIELAIRLAGDLGTTPEIKIAIGTLFAIPFYGHDLIEGWKEQFRGYPETYRAATLEKYLIQRDFAELYGKIANRNSEIWTRRELIERVYDTFAALGALNRIWFSEFQLKRSDAWCAKLEWAPPALAERARAIAEEPLDRAIPIAIGLFQDTRTLIRRSEELANVCPCSHPGPQEWVWMCLQAKL